MRGMFLGFSIKFPAYAPAFHAKFQGDRRVLYPLRDDMLQIWPKNTNPRASIPTTIIDQGQI